jgi:hypothetical protein
MQDPKQDPDLDLKESKKPNPFGHTSLVGVCSLHFQNLPKVVFVNFLNLEDGGCRGGRGGDRRGQIRGAGRFSDSASATTGVLRHPPRLHVSTVEDRYEELGGSRIQPPPQQQVVSYGTLLAYT